MMRGQGMWIWQIQHCEDGHVGRIVARARQAGLSHLLIKIADGERAYNDPHLAYLVEASREADMDLWAWQYTYGTGAAGEARFAAERYRDHPFAGFVVDAEAEYKGHGDRAREYMEALREELPDETIGFTSYQFPSLHPTLPWREFLGLADLSMPQVYWYSRDPVISLRRAIGEYQVYGLPIVPIGAAYPQAATPPQMQMFVREAIAQRLEAWTWWDWQHCTDAMWQVIGREEVRPPARRPLADVAREAPRAPWMEESYAVDRHGRRRPLVSQTGYCAAWAAECLAHAYDPTAGANARHSQGIFAYETVGRTADSWGDHLAAAGDAQLGRWIDLPRADELQLGDMLFWRQDVAGYPWSGGHVAILVDRKADGALMVSENSTSRGIGVHELPVQSLETMAGLMRWDLPDVEASPPEPDVAPWAEEAVKRLHELGIVTGYPDGTFRGAEALSRQEFAVAIARVLDAIGGDEHGMAGDDLWGTDR